MKIQALHIYGFGRWRDFPITLPANDFVFISGDNEAGKSTIRTFILFVLFGLPPKQRMHYQPKTGGPVGGMLVIHTKNYGEVRIERVHDRNNGAAVCRLANGEERDERFLRELTANLTQAAYQSIYSFSAEDLTELHGLTGEDLGEVLLSVGLTGSDHIYHTNKRLEKELEDRFKPKGKKPILNQQLHALEEVDKQQVVSEAEVLQYQQVIEEKQELVDRLEEVDRIIQRQRLKSSSYVRLQKVLPLIQEYHQIVHETYQAPVQTFPEHGKERLHRLQESLLPLESEHRLLLSKWKEKRHRKDQLQVESSLSLDKAIEILEKKPSYDQADQDAQRLYDSIRRIKEQVSSELDELHIDEHELREYDLPFYIEETWRNLKNEAQVIDGEEERLLEDEHALTRQKKRLKEQMDELKRRGPNEEEVVQQQKIVNSYVQEGAQGEGSQLNRVEMTIKEKKAATKRWFTVSVILLIISSLSVFFVSNLIVPFVIVVIGIVVATAAFFIRRTASEYSQLLESMKQKERPEELSEADYLQAKQLIEQYDKARGEYSYMKDRLRQLEHETLIISEKGHNLKERKQRLGALIDEQTTVYPFLSSLKSGHWEQLYHLLKQVKEKQKEADDLEVELKAVQQVKADILQALDDFYSTQNGEAARQSVSDKFAALATWVEKQQAMTVEISRIQEEVAHYEEELQRVNHQIYPHQTEKSNLLDRACANDVEQFYEQAMLVEQKREREKHKEQLIVQIKSMLNQQDQSAFEIWEKPKDPSGLAVEIDEIDRELQSLEEEQKSLQENIAEKKHRLEFLESSEQHSKLLHQRSVEQSAFNEQAKEWAVYQIASKVLKSTKARYQEKHLPQVIKRAENFFMRLTLGKYDRLFIDQNAAHLVVQDEQGHLYTTNELSRGTADQLYVALRLALGESMSHTIQAPFIVDDAFVNFDETRRKVMMELLRSLSNKNQIIVFTYRKDLAEEWNGYFLPSGKTKSRIRSQIGSINDKMFSD
ncbi:AAA family ATPase [Halobacillus shinanisalinarum]|uniref:AAA family ATPase n=1 Tax=Halobacillus shinanisalinarum TaxID=2932258 RepID=A0ABY4GXE3_9BACI|nr:AAA family ATPase [Halobacillus shinanisalinarum]UOQ92753.1 AAA family ATPase [Halobacillus shinanisalinarum]